MKITVLGSGSSAGVPMAGGFWGRCNPDNPKNYRTRASILVEQGQTRLLVDTSFDLRQQLNKYRIQHLDGVLITHEHADHTHGVDDLKAIAHHSEKRLDIYGSRWTMDEMERRWPYLFADMRGGLYVPFLEKRVIEHYTPFTVGDITVMPFDMEHVTCISSGYRFGDFAYCVDVATLDDRALETLAGVKVWIVDGGAYRRTGQTVHATLPQIEAWADRLKPEMTYVTVLSNNMDYDELCAELPAHIRPAYDGQVIEL